MEMMRFTLFLVYECINSFILLVAAEGGWVALTEDNNRGMSARVVRRGDSCPLGPWAVLGVCGRRKV